MMQKSDPSSSVASGLVILNTRWLDYPREEVFEAFRNIARLTQWWGPKDFTSTIHEFDFRPGGTWRLTLHGPNGANYDNTKQFLEISPPERIVFQHIQPIHNFRMTMTYQEASGGTRLTWRMEFEDQEENEKLRKFILNANEENFDRLEAFLAKS